MNALDAMMPTAEAINRLLYPYAEVVIHSISENKIHAIFNPLSKRQVGDDSLLSRTELSALSESTGPYEKTNWDGRKMKSISSVIRDTKGKTVGLLCINLDVSGFLNIHEQLMSFILPQYFEPQPEPLFKDDWQERINVCVHQYLKENNLSLSTLNRSDKKALIFHLHEVGAFSGKNSAHYIAGILDISRASVYKYLSEQSQNQLSNSR